MKFIARSSNAAASKAVQFPRILPPSSMTATAERCETSRQAQDVNSERQADNLDVGRYSNTLDDTELPHMQATISRWFERNVGLEGNNT